MSVYTDIELRCDGGPGPYDCEPAIYESTITRARNAARKQGWLVAHGGKDYCPKHRSSKGGAE